MRVLLASSIAWLAAGYWRFALLLSHEDAPGGYGAASRAHSGLLVLQGGLAFCAAWGSWWFAFEVNDPQPGKRRLFTGLFLGVAALGWLAMFAIPDLTAFGRYAN